MTAKLFPEFGGQEPKQHAALRSGLTFLPSAGQRLSPDVLVLELFRECFFDSGAVSADTASETQLNPEIDAVSNGLTDEQIAVIYALRGRKKETDSNYYYAPAYPEIAARAWLRRKSDRVVRDFFIRGPLAAYSAKASSQEVAALAQTTVEALLGDRREASRDILMDAMGNFPARGMRSSEQSVEYLLAEWREHSDFPFVLPDTLAVQVATDWRHLCQLEPFVSRLEWVMLLKTFLRCAIPCWLLSQMQITEIVRDAFRSSLIKGGRIEKDQIARRLSSRSVGLLIPTLTPSNPLDLMVAQYMRARIELNAIVHRLAMQDCALAAKLSREGVRLHLDSGEHAVGVEEAQQALVEIAAREPAAWSAIIHAVETVPAWLRPVSVGQGKNIEEFLRVMRDDHVGGRDDAYLLERTGPKNRKLFRLFPAARVLVLFVYLCQKRKDSGSAGETERVLLTDLESRFAAYGIDFSGVGGVRSHLVSRLQDLGLLRGSPDAGDGAELVSLLSHGRLGVEVGA